MNEKNLPYETFDFPVFLHGKIKERGISVKKLSEESGIALKHLENILRGEFRALPPAPYLRGYIFILGEILEFNAEDWWERIREETAVKRSGMTDSLPKNRFSNSSRVRNGVLIALAVIIIGIGIWRLPRIFGKPTIEIMVPRDQTTTVFEEAYTLRGKVSGGADQLSINNEAVAVDADGFWQKTVLLQFGMNVFEVKAKKLLGSEASLSRQIIYETPGKITTIPSPSSTTQTSSSSASSTKKQP